MARFRKHDRKMMQVVGILAGMVCLLLGYVLLENRSTHQDQLNPRDDQNFMQNERLMNDKKEDFTLMTADRSVRDDDSKADTLHGLNSGYAGADYIPNYQKIGDSTGGAIPEPTTLGLLGAGGMLMLYRRRNKNRLAA